MRLDLPEMKWATIPAGPFTMGALLSGEESQRSKLSTVESPRHVVTLTRSFYVLTTPVSEALWLHVMFQGNWAYWIAHKELATAWWLPNVLKTALSPVKVSWNDAVAFCNALSRLAKINEAYLINEDGVYWEGPAANGYRLPTEAEWEYACRAGADFDPTIRSLQEHEMGTNIRPANAFGVSGMEDGIYEWCWDIEGAAHLYRGTDEVDPLGPTQTSEERFTNIRERITRKGPYRLWCTEDTGQRGFRLVRTVRAPEKLT